MWTVLGIIVLVLVCLLAMIAVTVVSPVRIGVMARGDSRLDAVRGSLRLYDGLLGLGAQLGRGTSERPAPATLRLGLMVWRWFLPLYRVDLSPKTETPREPPERAEPTPAPERQAVPPGVPPERADRAVEAPVPYAQPAERRAGPVARPTQKPPRVEAPLGLPPAPRPPWYTRLRSQAQTVRAQWEEWSPVARGVLRRLRRTISIRRIAAKGHLGLNDPALTGLVVGWMSALRGCRTARIQVVGVYDGGMVARGMIQAEARINLHRIWLAGLYVGWVFLKRWYVGRKAASGRDHGTTVKEGESSNR